MSTLRTAVRHVTPVPLRRAIGNLLSKWANGYYHREMEWRLDYNHWVSVARLWRLKGKHVGERCFIIGNGPSLNKLDLSPLRNEISFGLNRIYLLFPRIGFHTTYYVSVNRLVIEQFAQDIERLRMPKFINWRARNAVRFTSDMIFVRDSYDGPLCFSERPASRIWEGHTVTYVAMQIAYYLGFQQVILIGVDHSFTTQGEPNKTVISEDSDLNHFAPDYFGKGIRWKLPDLEMSERAYQLARHYFEHDGREILDATVDGKLQVFPKVDYGTLF